MARIVRKEAKTVDEAVRLALEELGVPAERAEVNVLEEGKSGILGFGARNAVVEVSYEETLKDRILSFLTPILENMGIAPEIEIVETDEQISVKMNGENSGIAIGRRGETLDALQYLTSLVVNREKAEYTRVLMDVSDYRLKREETLVRLAQRVADKVSKTRRNVTLEPMNPYERRIIHSALQGFKDIETHSVGEEPNRKVVVRSTRSGYTDGPLQSASPEGGNRTGYGENRPPYGDRNGNRSFNNRGDSYGNRDASPVNHPVGYGSPSPHANPNSYRNRSTERIGYVGNPTASGSVLKPDEPVFKPFDIEDEIGEQP